jgi:hypothetical protein
LVVAVAREGALDKACLMVFNLPRQTTQKRNRYFSLLFHFQFVFLGAFWFSSLNLPSQQTNQQTNQHKPGASKVDCRTGKLEAFPSTKSSQLARLLYFNTYLRLCVGSPS